MERSPVRRIVTGHSPEGVAIVTAEGAPPRVIEFPSLPGTIFHEIWKVDELPAVLDNGPDPSLGPTRMSPAANGCAVRIVQIPPEGAGGLKMTQEQIAEHFSQTGSPEAATGEQRSPHPLMHRTETIDFGILIDGELTLILDESEVQLRPGDIVVQRGTNHAWSNRGDVPCRIAFVLLGGKYSDEIRQTLESNHA